MPEGGPDALVARALCRKGAGLLKNECGFRSRGKQAPGRTLAPRIRRAAGGQPDAFVELSQRQQAGVGHLDLDAQWLEKVENKQPSR